MLDSVTKKRIDDLRNILVGKIPSPQSQVEQITTGLIYKFMYDMDVEAVEMGGVPSFFVDDYEKYSWKHLFDPKLGGADKVQLYSDAIEKMYTNPSAPELFREIFKNSFLPFKDPSTLNMFLKEINEFHYSHSEKLGDAYEYLLSFMGSQGDAGQFRTPRHIIDFIVEIVNPQKNETILDPACGTAGFLISSYKHILSQNTDKKLGDKLNASDRKQVGDNLVGYDISPDMTRISLVNMYLHQFASPQIHEYDTLSSEDRWNEYYDVILANPPFFSPTGGIQPHSRFGVQSTRAEVLFVDYIMEHLKPTGRAGIVVPEGIIFQTGTAYKTLRKKLVEDCLVGVISLPAGVFQPYSGVKTSILILDKELNQKLDSIFFAKIENDGFSLGAQRTPIAKNDLPEILNDFGNFYDGSNLENESQIVPKSEVAEHDFSLSLSRYQSQQSELNSDYELVTIGSIADIERGGSPRPIKDFITSDPDGINWIKIGDAQDGSRYITETKEKIKPEGVRNSRYVESGDFILSNSMSFGRPYILKLNGCIHDGWLRLKYDESKVTEDYFYYILSSTPVYEQFSRLATGGVVNNLNKDLVSSAKIPLPPIEVQQQIVDELEGYQKIIDGCRQVVENYKPTIDIDPSWEMVELGDLVEVKGGKRLPKGEQFSDTPTLHPYVRVSDFKDFSVDTSNLKFISNDIHEQISRYVISSDDLYISIAGTIGLIGEIPEEISGANLTENAAKLVLKTNKISKEFLVYLSATTLVQTQIQTRTHAVGVPKLALERIRTIEIPVPSIDEQNEIVNSIKHEISVVKGNSNLISTYTQKIQDRISKVWGE
jgi:type I restriction enzyme M protein